MENELNYTQTNITFLEHYKKLDNLLKDYFSSNDGVTEYINQMEFVPFADRKYVSTWDYDYQSLKRARRIRNQLTHDVGTMNLDISSLDDLNFVDSFYNRIMTYSDPFTLIRKGKENEKMKNYQLKKARQTQQPTVTTISKNNTGTQQEKENVRKKSFFNRLWTKIKNFFS